MRATEVILTENQQARLNQLHSYCNRLKEICGDDEIVVNVLAWLLLIETDQ